MHNKALFTLAEFSDYSRLFRYNSATDAAQPV